MDTNIQGYSILPSWLFLHENNTNLSVPELFSTPGKKFKKSTFILLPFSINSISFATVFHALVTTSFEFIKLYRIRTFLLYFCDGYDVNLWQKKFSRSTAFSCRVNAFMEFHHFMKKEYTQLKTKQLEQNIFFNQ